MAYLAFDDTGLVPVAARAPAPATATVPVADPARPAARFSALEWSVVALARGDTVGSLRHPSRLAVAMRAVFRQPNPRLADERLEALRRMAVFSWHYGFTVPSREVQAFIAAGFTTDHYETLLASIGVAKRRDHRGA